VAVLLARGHSNPQIARALTIAPRTAMRRVEHVMAKLGVHSRAEIGAWAAQHGLLGPAGD
jgi:DNA-binding NarL/FixJ family response regulator